MLDPVDIGQAYRKRWGKRRKDRDESIVEPAGETNDDISYYGVPPVHKSHWGRPIALYFFLGGLSGAAYVVSAIAETEEGDSQRPIVRVGRYLSLVALIPGTVLLIEDLGRPSRFLNMLRVIKFRSPMSLGSWGLTVFGGFASLMAAVQAAEDGYLGDGPVASLLRRLPASEIGLVGAVPAFFVSGYTGVLLGATATPLWARNALLLGPLFIAASLSSAAAAIKTVLALTSAETKAHHDLEQMKQISMAVEAIILAAVVMRSDQVVDRMKYADHARKLAFGTVLSGMVAPIALAAFDRKQNHRFAEVAAGVLALAGGVVLRDVIVEAGNDSADDPQATFRTTAR